MTRPSALALVGLLLATGPPLASQTRTPAGTGRIAGRVVGDDGSTAVRRAIVTLSGSELPQSQSAISDDNGTFVFAGLPAGSFSLSASRPSFVTSAYGAKAPGQTGTRISIAAGQTVADAVIRMARGAVITGTVRNETGEPMRGIQVSVASARPADQRTGAMVTVGLAANPTISVNTDDRGMYRVFGLAAGPYFVAALMPQRGTAAPIEVMTSAQMDEAFRRAQQGTTRVGNPGSTATAPATRPAAPVLPTPPGPTFGYAPTFYPGTPDPGAATTVTVALGEERAGVDIVFALTPTVVIEGEVVNASGPLTRVALTLTPETQLPAIGTLRENPTLAVQPGTLPVPTGRFRYVNVTPGRYTITARTIRGQVTLAPDGSVTAIRMDGSDPPPPNLWAFAEVVVTSDGVSGLTMSLRPGLSMSGRVRFDRTSLTPPESLTSLRVGLARATPSVGGSMTTNTGASFGALPAPTGIVQADGTFDLSPLYPGTYRLTAAMPPATGGAWWLRSAIMAGRDLLDEPLTIASDGDIPPVVVTYSDRHTALNGSLQTPTGAPATDYFVIVFSADRRFWLPESRRLAFVRPATDGRFTFRDLPPGEYHVAALTDLDTDTWRTPDFLDQVVPGSFRITLGEGETRTQDLRIAQ